MGLLDGKVAIITGAARGQGEATARLFHAEGVSLILTDVNPAGEALAKALGGNAVFQRLDVAAQADCTPSPIWRSDRSARWTSW
jgi:3alpha(or 20beta)-hydroxysteroid dehydrogenase